MISEGAGSRRYFFFAFTPLKIICLLDYHDNDDNDIFEKICNITGTIWWWWWYLLSYLRYDDTTILETECCKQGRKWGGRWRCAPPHPVFHNLAMDMYLNSSAPHFTLRQRPCIISSFLLQIYRCPPLKIARFTPLVAKPF